MVELLAPGVYTIETSFRARSIQGVGTSTTGFVGMARSGPVGGPPQLITSFAEFERIYGGLAEAHPIGTVDRVRCLQSDTTQLACDGRPRVIYGPTCDSIDRLPDPLALPEGLDEGDYVLFDGMGAYSIAMGTRFNGYGKADLVTVQRLTA